LRAFARSARVTNRRVAVIASRHAAMERRRFGRTDLIVSEFGLGCARIGGIFKREPSEFVNLLSAAFDAGITFYDTSDIYSQGESETLIGRAFRGRRDRVVIASKAGYQLPSQRKVIARLKPLVRPMIRLIKLSRAQLPTAVRGSLGQDFSPAHLRRSLDGSLRRLGTDYLDLFQLHSPPLDVVRANEWVETLEDLKRQGKIRHYGVSCDGAPEVLAALEHPTVEAVQLPINLIERRFEDALAAAHRHNVGVIARECLANGLLVKDAAAVDVRSYCQSDEEAALKTAQLDHLRRTAKDRGMTLTQLALEFVTQREGVSVTLIGVSSIQQLNSLIVQALGPAAAPDAAQRARTS